jgi:hypothetical protein
MAKEITQFQGEWRFLSNFWLCPVPVGGIEYKSAEHAYQAHKTLDHRAREAMAALSTPRDAKRAGQVIDLRTDWERAKKAIMLQVVLVKFMKNADLARQLVATEDAYLEEGNTWHDNYWGSCGCPKCIGTGLNYLGRILTMVRDIVRVDG